MSTTTTAEAKLPAMTYKRLGNTGLKVSRICLGCGTFGKAGAMGALGVMEEADSKPFIARALELGINFFDTADGYSQGASESVLGNVLHELKVKRDDVVIATKVFFPMGKGPNDKGLSRKHIFASIDASLARLRTTYVDLYQTHRWDPETPIEETMEALNDLVRSGKVRYIGASSMYAWQFAKAQAVARERGWTQFVSMQNYYNLAYREEEREMNPFCVDSGVGLLPWSPLAGGFLARARGTESKSGEGRAAMLDQWKFDQPSHFAVLDKLTEVSRRLGKPQSQVALAWLLTKPGVTSPIIGVTKIHHLDDAVAALGVTVSKEDATVLEAEYRAQAIKGHT